MIGPIYLDIIICVMIIATIIAIVKLILFSGD